MALRAARRCGAEGKELRRLQWQALELSRAACGSPVGAGSSGYWGEELFADVEDILAAVAAGSGQPAARLTVGQAKVRLRQFGSDGWALASRLGRLSKLRNSRAHPDRGLKQAVQALTWEAKAACCSGGFAEETEGNDEA